MLPLCPAPEDTVAIAVLIPTTAPLPSTSAPPELPKLIAASVWIASSTASVSVPSPSSGTGRCSELTMPRVTVPARPSGEPIASTESPTVSVSESPRVAATRPGRSTLSTARSVFGSRPTIFAGTDDWSAKITRMLPLLPAAADTTWLLVTMCPLPSTTTPDPVPDRSLDRISMDTTAGSTRLATSATEPGERCTFGVTLVSVASGESRLSTPDRFASTYPVTPPAVPTSNPTSSSTRAVASGSRGSPNRRRPPAATSSAAGAGCRWPVRSGGRARWAGAAGSRHGSRGASGFHHGELPAGRLVNRAPGGGANGPAPPSGRLNAAASTGGGAGRGTGRCSPAGG